MLINKAFSHLITLLELWFPWKTDTEEMDGGAELDSVELCSFTHESLGVFYPLSESLLRPFLLLSLGNGLWPGTPEKLCLCASNFACCKRSGEDLSQYRSTPLRGLSTECQPQSKILLL